MTQTGGVCDLGPRGEPPGSLPARVTTTVGRGAPAALTITTLAAAIAGSVADVPWTTIVVLLALLPAAVIDLDEHRLPNRLLARAAAAGAITLVVEHLAGSRLDGLTVRSLLTTVAMGVLVGGGSLLVLHLASPAAMGFGDVKASAILGGATALVHPLAPIVALAVAGAIGTVIGLAGRRRRLPFGPTLLVGAAVAAVLTSTVVTT